MTVAIVTAAEMHGDADVAVDVVLYVVVDVACP